MPVELVDSDLRRTQALLRAEAEHRLKTSLAVVTGWAATLDDDWDKLSDDTRRRAVGIIRRVSDDMAQEAARLLDQARAELLTLDPEPVRLDLAAVLDVTADALDGLSRDHAVVYEPASGPVFTDVDPAGLQQVLGHLIENAVKYSADGTKVAVRVLADIERRQAVLEVRDEGAGIPLDRDIFSPFTRGPQADDLPGAGLGLYVVRNLVTSINGEVEAQRHADGPGSTFRVRLPLAQ